MSEVVLDEGGIELLWRVHFGFFDPVVAGNDTDGDGLTDADEEKDWSDPRNKNEPDPKKSPEQRRQDVIEAMRPTDVTLAGKPATHAEMLAQEYIANAGIRTRIAMSQEAAHARVEAWSKRTSHKRDYFRGGVVTDVEGEAPVIQYDYGIISNTSANVMPLWSDPSLGSYVTGYGLINNVTTRQICGMWENHVPLNTHNELIGRVTFGDTSLPGPDSSHATAVAGIIGAAGTAGFDFRGVAYQCGIRAYKNDETTYTKLLDLQSLPVTGENLLKRMRASNHSYGPNGGWGKPDDNGTRQWEGDILQVVNAPYPEDYHFGLYDEDAKEADDTAYALPYHLLIRAAGNEKKNGAKGAFFSLINPFAANDHLYCLASWIGTGQLREPIYVAIAALNGTSNSYWIKKAHVVPKRQSNDPASPEYQVILGYEANSIDNLHSIVLNEFPTDGTTLLDSILDPETEEWSDVTGHFDCLPGGFTVSKNALCVGAIGVNGATNYSGTGPTDDGRIKPDVVAYGGEDFGNGDIEPFPLLGAAGVSDYTYEDVGTSFAAPAVAGAVTLLSEWQEKEKGLYNKEPYRASTFKALICHTATHMPAPVVPGLPGMANPPPGPNFTFGWGKVNATAAAEMIKTNYNREKITEVFLPHGSAFASIKLRAIGTGPLGNQPSKPIKVTIAWTDPSGNIQPDDIDGQGSTLKHDINLKLIKTQMPAGVTVYPWKPNPATPHQPYLPVTPPPDATESWYQNHRDNIEQVYIPAPLYNEEWEIKITSSTPLTAGTTPGQWVSVIMEGLFRPGPVEGTILSSSFQYGQMYNVVFSTAMGGYYQVQYFPNAYNGTWENAPGLGIIKARSDVYSAWFYVTPPASPVPLRIVKLSPYPF